MPNSGASHAKGPTDGDSPDDSEGFLHLGGEKSEVQGDPARIEGREDGGKADEDEDQDGHQQTADHLTISTGPKAALLDSPVRPTLSP